MISWFNAPNEGLSPGGQLTLKTLTATENKTYSEEGTAYTSVTVNVEGGGGGGDLSIAEVIFSVTGNASATLYDFVVIADLPSGNRTLTHFDELVINSSSASIYTIPMVDGKIDMGISSEDTITTSGNVEYLPDDEYIIITGDCTITIS